MYKNLNNAAQHTLDWYRARLGHITGSNVGLIMKGGRGKEFSDTAESYLYDVAGDRTLNPNIVQNDELFEAYLDQRNVSTKAMKWGNEQEGNARKLYSAKTGRKMVEVGSCKHPSIPFFASSPDGFFYDETKEEKICLEIKCLGHKEYMRYIHLVNDADSLLKINAQYYYQCFSHMMVTGASATDFVIYNPFQSIPIKIIRIEENEKVFDNIKRRVELGNKFIDEIIESNFVGTIFMKTA
jgi:hypothetical protein